MNFKIRIESEYGDLMLSSEYSQIDDLIAMLGSFERSDAYKRAKLEGKIPDHELLPF